MKRKKLKNNGFTLIELLAVIVILAVIALIAVPQILRILKQARLSAAEDTTYGIVDSTNSYLAHLMLTNSGDLPVSEFEFVCNGTTCTLIDEIKNKLNGFQYNEKLDFKGTIPKSGTITVENNGTLITATNLKINEFTCQYNNEVASCEDSNGTSTSTSTTTTTTTVTQQSNISVNKGEDDTLNKGDVITIGTEKFDVMYTENGKVYMLAQYNLNVGPNKISGTEGIQNTRAIGYNSDSSTKSGDYYPATLAFSVSPHNNYWNGSVSSYPAEVYDSRSNLYQYVEAYKTTLEELGATIEEARLLKYDEATTKLGCVGASTYKCPTSGENAFVTRTSFWLGAARGNGYVWFVYSNGYFDGGSYDDNYYRGVRPVIVMLESDLN